MKPKFFTGKEDPDVVRYASGIKDIDTQTRNAIIYHKCKSDADVVEEIHNIVRMPGIGAKRANKLMKMFGVDVKSVDGKTREGICLMLEGIVGTIKDKQESQDANALKLSMSNHGNIVGVKLYSKNMRLVANGINAIVMASGEKNGKDNEDDH